MPKAVELLTLDVTTYAYDNENLVRPPEGGILDAGVSTSAANVVGQGSRRDLSDVARNGARVRILQWRGL